MELSAEDRRLIKHSIWRWAVECAEIAQDCKHVPSKEMFEARTKRLRELAAMFEKGDK